MVVVTLIRYGREFLRGITGGGRGEGGGDWGASGDRYYFMQWGAFQEKCHEGSKGEERVFPARRRKSSNPAEDEWINHRERVD